MQCYQCDAGIEGIAYGHFIQEGPYIENAHPGCYFCETCVDTARKVTKCVLQLRQCREVDTVVDGCFPITCPLKKCQNIILIENGLGHRGVIPKSRFHLRKNARRQLVFLPTLERKKLQWIEYRYADGTRSYALTF